MAQAKSSISSSKYVLNDLLKLPDNVSIVCDDGEVRANMELLSVRSDFFSRGFNNPCFMESQNKSIRMKGCSKAAMEAVKTYLYTGKMNFDELGMHTLLYIMNVSREILIEEELFNCIETYIKHQTRCLWKYEGERRKKKHRGILPRSFELVERFRLDDLWDVLLKHFNLHLAYLTGRMNRYAYAVLDREMEKITMKAVDRNKMVILEDLKSLPLNIVKKILLCGVGAGYTAVMLKSLTKGRFQCFLAWYEANEEICSDEDKKEILQSFNFDHFTGEELVNVVGRSGLLPRKEVDRMVVERFRKCGEGNNQ